MFRIDLSESLAEYSCTDCAKPATVASGWVHEDDRARAAYFACLLTSHKERPVLLTLSVGSWGEGAEPGGRHLLLLEVRPTKDRRAMMVRNARDSRYFGEKLLGVPLQRERALAWDGLEDAYALADFIVTCDPAVQSFLKNGRISRAGREGAAAE